MSLRSSNRYYAMPSELDLTQFRFTATESLAYAALLRLGPSTGYAVAHATRVARANTYGALEGLVTRTAALRLAGRPARRAAARPCGSPDLRGHHRCWREPRAWHGPPRSRWMDRAAARPRRPG